MNPWGSLPNPEKCNVYDGTPYHDLSRAQGFLNCRLLIRRGSPPDAITPKKVIIVPKAGGEWGTRSVPSSVMPVFFYFLLL
jgi:hypothetical protein